MAQSTPVPDGSKRCTKCGEVKLLDEFHRNKSKKSGRASECKPCDQVRRRRYYEANREAVKAKARAYFEANREDVARASARYYEANREDVKAKARAYYEANATRARELSRARYAKNRERALAYRREYYLKNGDRLREYAISYYAANTERRKQYLADYRMANPERLSALGHARRSRVRGAGYDSTVTVLALRDRDGDRCCYCNVVMSFCGARDAPSRANLEHITPISRGGAHTFENTALACHACNLTKHTRLFIWEWVPPFPTAAA